MTIGNEMLAACQGFRNALEGDCLPVRVGDKFNVIEGLGALFYQPCMYSLSKVIRVFEKDTADRWAHIAQQVAGLFMVVLTAPIAGVGCVVKRIGAMLPHDRTPRTDEVFQRTAPEKIDQLYDIIEGFSEAAQEIGLDYRMGSGTALGAVRHQGIIPWDDDGDFVIMNSEKEKVEQAIKDGVFKNRGLEIQFYPGMENYEIRFTDEERMRRGCTSPAAIDLFIMEKVTTMEDKKPVVRIGYASTFISEHFPHDYFTAQEWEQTRDWNFGPGNRIVLRGLNQEVMEGYVRRGYGEDCLTCGLKTHSHAEISIFGYRFSGLGLPVVTREKVQIVDCNPAYGLKWKP
jgi:hypothetical protein